MRKPILLVLVATALAAIIPSGLAAQMQRDLVTEKGETHDTPVPHPLSWWTDNPLRLDDEMVPRPSSWVPAKKTLSPPPAVVIIAGNLMLGFKAKDGRPITSHDYKVEEQVTTLGTLAEHKIVQVILNIAPGPRAIAYAFQLPGGPPAQWKSLLVQTNRGNRYIEIYALRVDQGGLYQPFKSAKIYGSGPNAILGTYDPDSGNGGGCGDGYWWFDKAGVYPVDFQPLYNAIGTVIPPHTIYTPNGWALHPEKSELRSGVQEFDAQCHACGFVGQVGAVYRIDHGAAIPVSVHFEPNPCPPPVPSRPKPIFPHSLTGPARASASLGAERP